MGVERDQGDHNQSRSDDIFLRAVEHYKLYLRNKHPRWTEDQIQEEAELARQHEVLRDAIVTHERMDELLEENNLLGKGGLKRWYEAEEESLDEEG